MKILNLGSGTCGFSVKRALRSLKRCSVDVRSLRAIKQRQDLRKKNLTYWHWFEASKELKDRYGQTDLNTGWWFEPKDLNNWIIPLVGKIWEAYNYTMLVFCVKKVEQKARAEAVGDIIRPCELLDLDLEEDGEDMKVQEEVLVYHSNSQFVPDWGLTADGFES